jgi:exonuclease III
VTNSGLRLDYFVCSDNLYGNVIDADESTTENGIVGKVQRIIMEDIPRPGVLDSYLLHEDTIGISDHCPAVLLIQI